MSVNHHESRLFVHIYQDELRAPRRDKVTWCVTDDGHVLTLESLSYSDLVTMIESWPFCIE